ncbi:hypothetical protein [Rhizobium sp. SSA_523]|uniref:hypothetical protein n=1 Tax=Rhizobium sp. SSA_523 TaxID=2952477 RepID=UPI0020905111|nr:hypothetical protein [Rhizobium sp. SSA_523]MCO5732377.1 hypothetical protein [Rhizobium sp. SSA_523]WKC21228.1 hypothetical protein QTJ18_04880 [Rhizobium sp. SSA_523]
MTKAVLLGLSGEQNLWIVDLEKGSVSQLDAPMSEKLAEAASMRDIEGAVMKGIDLAVALPSSTRIAQGLFEG